jgi:hypothetical protein
MLATTLRKGESFPTYLPVCADQFDSRGRPSKRRILEAPAIVVTSSSTAVEVNSPITFHESPDHAPNSTSSSSAGTYQGVKGLLAFSNATAYTQDVGSAGRGQSEVGNSGAGNSGAVLQVY